MIRFVNLQDFLSALWVETRFSFNVPLEHSNGKPWLQMRVSSYNLLWWLEVRFFVVEKARPWFTCELFVSCLLVLYEFETIRG